VEENVVSLGGKGAWKNLKRATEKGNVRWAKMDRSAVVLGPKANIDTPNKMH